MLSTKRWPSVNATLRKPALSFCSRCEALVASKSPNSKKRPPILPGGRFLSQPGLVVFVSSVTFGEPGPSANPMGGTGAGIRYSPRCRSGGEGHSNLSATIRFVFQPSSRTTPPWALSGSRGSREVKVAVRDRHVHASRAADDFDLCIEVLRKRLDEGCAQAALRRTGGGIRLSDSVVGHD